MLTWGCVGPMACSLMAMQRSYMACASACRPIAFSSTARLFRQAATSGCCLPRVASLISRTCLHSA